MNKFIIYLKNIVIALAVGGIIGFIISDFIDYSELIKPPLAPPGYVFGIVWSILYILMGISYSILEVNKDLDEKIKKVYYIQLFVNALWSIIFFVLKLRFISIAWIILLIIFIIKMIKLFYNKNKISAYLQIPYLIWTAFATYLNIGVYLLNR